MIPSLGSIYFLPGNAVVHYFDRSQIKSFAWPQRYDIISRENIEDRVTAADLLPLFNQHFHIRLFSRSVFSSRLFVVVSSALRKWHLTQLFVITHNNIKLDTSSVYFVSSVVRDVIVPFIRCAELYKNECCFNIGYNVHRFVEFFFDISCANMFLCNGFVCYEVRTI